MGIQASSSRMIQECIVTIQEKAINFENMGLCWIWRVPHGCCFVRKRQAFKWATRLHTTSPRCYLGRSLTSTWFALAISKKRNIENMVVTDIVLENKNREVVCDKALADWNWKRLNDLTVWKSVAGSVIGTVDKSIRLRHAKRNINRRVSSVSPRETKQSKDQHPHADLIL